MHILFCVSLYHHYSDSSSSSSATSSIKLKLSDDTAPASSTPCCFTPKLEYVLKGAKKKTPANVRQDCQ